MDTTLLLVDDEPVSLRVLAKLLSDKPYQLLEAKTGAVALELLQARDDIQLVLLDVGLPDVNGIDLCRRIKEDPATAGTGIVLISGLHTDSDRIREGLEAGADGFLTKPFEPNALRAWVASTLRIVGLQRRLAEEPSPEFQTAEERLQHFNALIHAVNNPLQAIIANADLLELHLTDDPEAQEFLNEISENAETVATILMQMAMQSTKRGAPSRSDS